MIRSRCELRATMPVESDEAGCWRPVSADVMIRPFGGWHAPTAIREVPR